MRPGTRVIGRFWGALLTVVLFGFAVSGCGKTSATSSGTQTKTSVTSSAAQTNTSATSSSAQTKTSAASSSTSQSTATSTALIAATQGQYVMVKLAYDEQVFGVTGQACSAPCFDVGGWSMDPTDPVWPTQPGPVTVKGIPVWFPATGNGTKAVQSAVNFGVQHGRTAMVPVPQGTYSTLYLIEAAGNGNHHGVLTFKYSNGSTGTAQMFVDDWCTSAPQGGVTAFQSSRLTNKGAPQSGSPCAVFLATVPLTNTTGTLTSVMFSQSPGTSHKQFEPEILAMTLKKA